MAYNNLVMAMYMHTSVSPLISPVAKLHVIINNNGLLGIKGSLAAENIQTYGAKKNKL